MDHCKWRKLINDIKYTKIKRVFFSGTGYLGCPG